MRCIIKNNSSGINKGAHRRDHELTDYILIIILGVSGKLTVVTYAQSGNEK